jgi:hypothetical protein
LEHRIERIAQAVLVGKRICEQPPEVTSAILEPVDKSWNSIPAVDRKEYYKIS